MLTSALALIAAARVFFQSRTDVAVEVLALRQQVAVLKRKRPKPPLGPMDRKPETVVGLASGWFPAVLALEISAVWRPAEDHGGNSRSDSTSGAGELRLGRAEDPLRVAEARLRALREDRRALFAGPPSPG